MPNVKGEPSAAGGRERAGRRSRLRLPPMESVVRWATWAASILVIVIYLLTSLSRPEPRGVASQVRPDSLDLGAPAAPVRDPPEPVVDLNSAVFFAQWADLPADWRTGDLGPQDSAYHEGEAVPFMLRVDDAARGDTYAFRIRVPCSYGARVAYDSLTSYRSDRGTAPALHADGPGRAIPDATLRVAAEPDDAESEPTFELWGGVFTGPAAVEPPDPCHSGPTPQSQGAYTVTVTARSGTVYLLWSAHLAPTRPEARSGAALDDAAPHGFAVPGPTLGVDGRQLAIAGEAILPPVASLSSESPAAP